MAKTDYQSIDEYHAAYPGAATRMQQIRDLIHKMIPEVEEAISYQIPCFRYKGYLIYYSTYTNHLTISYPWSAAFRKHFEQQLAGYKMSKSAIQFPHKDNLDIELIAQIIDFRKKENNGSL